jgi:fused signal recognition particle receptor
MFNFFKKNKSIPEDNEPKSLTQQLKKTHQILGSGLSTLLLGKKQIDEELLEALEILLISADIGLTTTDKVLEIVRQTANRQTLKDKDSLYALVKQTLASLLNTSPLKLTPNETFVILILGVNGAGKTTTIGKLAKRFQNEGKSVMLAAGDTFRAAAVEQLKVWGERNQIPVVAQSTGSDSASVIFDAYQSAQTKKIDILIADTAGRLHTQENLMQELEKIKRVIAKQNPTAPHEVMLIVDGTSGQNALNQAKAFHQSIGLDSISITKLDGTAKGGVIFAISDELKLPIRYIGVGEGIEDLQPFNAEKFAQALFA